MKREQTGFTLVELLVVVAILGILTAIAIPALQTSVDKSKQRATMADMRGIATGIQLYDIDESIYPADGTPPSVLVALIRTYVKVTLPDTDAWYHPYGYNSDSLSWYSLQSFGKDGIDGVDITPTTKYQFELDLVYATGHFSNAPE